MPGRARKTPTRPGPRPVEKRQAVLPRFKPRPEPQPTNFGTTHGCAVSKKRCDRTPRQTGPNAARTPHEDSKGIHIHALKREHQRECLFRAKDDPAGRFAVAIGCSWSHRRRFDPIERRAFGCTAWRRADPTQVSRRRSQSRSRDSTKQPVRLGQKIRKRNSTR